MPRIIKKCVQDSGYISVRVCCLTGALFAYSSSVFAVLPNTALPQGGNFIHGTGHIGQHGTIMNVSQNTGNAVIKWDDFSIGGNATVNFTGPKTNFNVLNYVDSGKMSRIYGNLNAKDGNVFLVNTAGTLIAKSAQIDVGSLYVSNKKMSESQLAAFQNNATINGTNTGAELMSLGYVKANKISFDGDRIVLDNDRLSNSVGVPMNVDNKNVVINTTDANEVVIGHTVYTDEYKTYAGGEKNFKVNVNSAEQDVKGYMWIKDVEQLQAMNTNLSGNYALHNSIDATNTMEAGKHFQSIGNETTKFTGKLDGLASGIDDVSHSIFELTIDGSNNVGLFGITDNASIKNLIITSGKVNGTGNNVGSIVGSASNTVIQNIASTMDVTGHQNVGGIAGNIVGGHASNLYNSGYITGHQNVGGIVGSLSNSILDGQSHNMGQIRGDNNTSFNVGGLVGYASDSIIGTVGKDAPLIINQLTVAGGYNIGGIVGSAYNTDIYNAKNLSNILGTGFTTEILVYHTSSHKQDVANGDKQDGYARVEVNVSNVGGIAGNVKGNATISNVVNEGGNVRTSVEKNSNDIYKAGNVGGIIGRAEGIIDASSKGTGIVISNALNKENNVRGAHNIGGIVGYFENGTITQSTNSGGNIMGTGARNKNGFVQEIIRRNNNEPFNIGNIGGIAGYMFGDSAFISQSGNRGDVHSQYISGDVIPETAKAANVGGIVGKISRNNTKSLDDIKNKVHGAAISESYNTGNVQGFTGVGGIAGMMYNGEVEGSYNLGIVSSTRKSNTHLQSVDPLNMGGIVGDSTEKTNAKVLIYNVYNSGQVGNEKYTTYGRHVGGVIGRLSGDVVQSYNTGAIYNGYNVVGGIVGWMYKGSIVNSFNAGNITVLNRNSAESQVGGIVGAVDLSPGDIVISNVYNLGVLRSFQSNIGGENSLGGIVGQINNWDQNKDSKLEISNAYTLGKLYGAKIAPDGVVSKNNNGVNQIIGKTKGEPHDIKNTYYIAPDETTKDSFIDLSAKDKQQVNKYIEYANRTKADEYKYVDKDGNTIKLNFSSDNGSHSGDVTDDGDWRIYEGSTIPILNAFTPSAEGFFAGNKTEMEKLDKIQYGTAYNPLLTIITANQQNSTLTYDWKKLNASNNSSFAVYNAGLTIENFYNKGNYFGGTIYSDGALSINGQDDQIMLIGSAGKLYGSSVNIDACGDLYMYGRIDTTGKNDNGSIDITGDSVEIIGQLISAKGGEKTLVPEVAGTVVEHKGDYSDIANVKVAMPSVGSLYGTHITAATGVKGDVNITASKGDVEVLYGVAKNGKVIAYGNYNIKATGNVYIDSDIDAQSNLNITSPGEIVMDGSNIGKVDSNSREESNKKFHKFLDHFSNTNVNSGVINLNSGIEGVKADAIVTMDIWDSNKKTFDLNMYDLDNTIEGDFTRKINNLKVTNNGENLTGRNITYIWVSDAEQLKGIQVYAEKNPNENFLSYNFALKNNIDANGLKEYKAIGSGSEAFNGDFRGLNNNIVGLKVEATNGNAGIFAHIGKNGRVNDVNVISSDFKGASVGVIAGLNEGKIKNVTTFGNDIISEGNVRLPDEIGSVGAAGGVAGINSGTIDKANVNDVVIADSTNDAIGQSIDSSAGGIAGVNSGLIKNSSTNSAITSNNDDARALGGIVGINLGKVDNVDSYGIVNGSYKGKDKVYLTENIGGIVGANFNGGSVINAYNEAYVFGSNAVGGIVGYSGANNHLGVSEKNVIQNVVNSGIIISSSEGLKDEQGRPDLSHNTGGLIGNNINTNLSDARNTGYIVGGENVGGLVGNNGQYSTMTNIVNDGSASINGEKYVGGIAGKNSGTIDAKKSNLINNGKIYGNQYVGGIAGYNTSTGKISNTINDISLFVKGNDAKYFGGVAGLNEGTISDAMNRGSVNAKDATYVGGIAGHNKGVLANAGNSKTGKVEGKDFVGGVAGLNDGTLANGVTIENHGEVIAHLGGAGGIFAKNTADAETVILINDGKVTGSDSKGSVDGTGGIFGVNIGSFTHSSMYNTVNGQVSGHSNVGGLIGINSGNITGGRDDAGNYYKDQIYNNGVINATGDNVGGLFGQNSGRIIAAYNTGAVNGVNNVGGIAGVNSGSIDQVFNNVINDGFINGTLNVGAIVGDNSGAGKVVDAYTTTNVKGNANDKALVGIGNEVSFDKAKWNSYGDGAVEGTNKLLSVFLTKLHFEPIQENLNKIIYNAGKQAVTIQGEKNVNGNIILNVVVGDVVIGTLTTASMVNDADAAHSLQDYINSNVLLNPNKDAQNAGEYLLFGTKQIDGHNNLGFDIADFKFNIKKATIDLILNTVERVYGNTTITKGEYGYDFSANVNEAMKNELSGGITMTDKSDAAVDGLAAGKTTNDAGDYSWRGKFTMSSDLANNYQFDNNGSSSKVFTGVSVINKAQLSINVGNVSTIYGTAFNEKDYSYDFEAGKGLVNGDKADILGNIIYANSAVGTGGKVTADAGTHMDAVGITGLNELKNYNVTVNKGDAVINKAQLSINVGNVSTEYGVKFDESEYTHTTSGLVNGDNENVLGEIIYKNEAAFDGSNGKVTADAGIHAGAIDLDRTNLNNLKNYDVTVNKGDASIAKKIINIGLKDKVHIYGDKETADHVINGNIGWVNGDKYSNGDVILNVTDGAYTDGKTNDVGDYKVTGNAAGAGANAATINKNYDFVVVGNSKVEQKEISLNDFVANIVYGTKGDKFTVGNISINEGGLVYGDKVTVGGNAKYDVVVGGEYDTNRGGRDTADAGNYVDSLKVSGLTLIGDKASNYKLSGTSMLGDIKVDKAQLSINVGNVSTEYGTKFDESEYTHTTSGLVNGDNENVLGEIIYKNEAAFDGSNGKWTADAGIHAGAIDLDRTNMNNLKNYDVTVNKGDAVINKAQLAINANDLTLELGSKPNYTGSISGLVNGDEQYESIFGITDTKLE